VVVNEVEGKGKWGRRTRDGEAGGWAGFEDARRGARVPGGRPADVSHPGI
jgi:hypothetical protein